jgi:hypothetical protein
VRTIWSRSRDSDAGLEVTSGSTLRRDVYKAVTAGFTGITAFGALAVTGAVAGTAAHQKAAGDAAGPPPTTPPAPTVTKRRPHRTIVRTEIVHVVSGNGVARASTGGTVSSSGAAGSASHSSTAGHSASAPRPAAAPAPKPAPAAPSSGS